MPCRYEDVQACSRRRQSTHREANKQACKETHVCPSIQELSQSAPVGIYGPSAIPIPIHSNRNTHPHTHTHPLQLFSSCRWYRGFGNSHTDGAMANFTFIHVCVCECNNHLEPCRQRIPPEISQAWFDIIKTHTHTWCWYLHINCSTVRTFTNDSRLTLKSWNVWFWDFLSRKGH